MDARQPIRCFFSPQVLHLKLESALSEKSTSKNGKNPPDDFVYSPATFFPLEPVALVLPATAPLLPM
jgi:hypothetical protein